MSEGKQGYQESVEIEFSEKNVLISSKQKGKSNQKKDRKKLPIWDPTNGNEAESPHWKWSKRWHSKTVE